MTVKDEKLHRFITNLKDDAEVMDEQRVLANEDMRFSNVPGGMWEGFLEETFDDDRVKLELDLVDSYVQRFIGEWNQNRVGVEYKPNDAGTTKDDSDLLNGIYRSDFRQFSGKPATDNAVSELADCGYGAFKLATVFEDDEDPENDNMNVEWRPVYNAFNTIFWDQSAKRDDKRDARHCTELAQYTVDSFKAEFPGRNPVSAFNPESMNMNTSKFRRIDIIYVATRYEVVKRQVTMFVYNDLQTQKITAYSKEDHDLIKDELAANELIVFVRERKISKRIVEKTVFSGDAILEDTRRIAGKWIPIIPMYATRKYVDGTEWYRGLVRKFKDACRLFNMQVSQLAENSASGGQEVPIFDPSQVEGEIGDFWADKNNQPYLLANALRDADGNITHVGPIAYSKPGMLDQSTTTLLGIVPQFIQDKTGGAPQEAFSKDMSGKAINALIKRENMNTQPINDNIAAAIAWSGEVYQAIAAEIYTTRRIVKTIGKDGTEAEVQLSESVMDEETGQMIESNTISGKKFQSYPDAGPQYETVREQTVEDIKGMLETLSTMPAGEQYLPVLMAVLMENITGVGLDPVKDLNRKIMLLQGLIKPNTPEEKQLVEQAQQPKADPQQELIQAATQQQQAEAANLEASADNKVADTAKKEAETAKIIAETGDVLFAEPEPAAPKRGVMN